MKKNKINSGNIIQSIFKTFLLSLAIISQVHFVYAQTTASILPPAKTTFFDNNGNPLSSGTVESFIPLTSTHKTTWQDAAETIPNLNPLTLDAAGRALLLGSGSYRQVVKDRNGNLIWDQVTSSAGSGSGGSTATGDGDLVGTIKPWAGINAPNQYMFTYGQTLSRVTYSALFNAITSTQSVFCSSGSPIIPGLSDTTNFWIGMSVETSCVPAGFTTIISKTSSSVTLAVNANVTVNTTITFFPWGNGNHSTTFTLPDLRGQVLAANNNMGGSASGNLNTTYFGAQSPNSMGGSGGSQSITLSTSNLPPYTPTGTVQSSSLVLGPPALSGANIADTNSAPNQPFSITSIFTGDPQGGTSVPFSSLQPTRMTNFIIKVTPDANSATASGVTSLGTMTGDIACGTGLLCTGNIISTTSASLVVGSSSISGGTSNGLLYNNGGALGNLTTLNNAVLTTNGVGLPLMATTLPAGINLNTATATTINGLSLFSSNSQANIGVGTALPSQSGATNNVFVTTSNALTTGDQNVILGTGGTGASLTIDTGNTLIGYDVAPSLHNAVIPSNYNTAIGNQALRQCTTCGSNVAIGRAAELAETTGDHNTAVGHAAEFAGSGNIQTTAIGDSAGGAALAGTPIPAGFPNVGVNVFGFNGDTNLECIGETCGKATSAARKQSWCYGSYCRIPALDNIGWLGNGMQAVGTQGRLYDGNKSATVTSNVGVTLTCAQMLAGSLIRSGTASAGFTDTTPTAAQIVTCATNGAGNGAEASGVSFTYFNNGTGFTATLAAGAGVTFNGVGTPTIGSNVAVTYRIRITNSTAGTEAVVIDTFPDPSNASFLTQGTLPVARLNLSQITNSLGADVALNNTANFFDGPSVAQGSTGTWFASGTVTLTDPTGVNDRVFCKLWDGTTVISSGATFTTTNTTSMTVALSGYLASPAANIRISCKNISTTTGFISFNASGASKDSTLSAFRIN